MLNSTLDVFVRTFGGIWELGIDFLGDIGRSMGWATATLRFRKNKTNLGHE